MSTPGRYCAPDLGLGIGPVDGLRWSPEASAAAALPGQGIPRLQRVAACVNPMPFLRPCSLATLAGPLGVEFFLVTTGMLATYQLVPQLEGAGARRASPAGVVLRYWRRRAARILPAYAAANLLVLLALAPAAGLPLEQAVARAYNYGQCPGGLWRNALFITNQDPSKGCGERGWMARKQLRRMLCIICCPIQRVISKGRGSARPLLMLCGRQPVG